MMDLGAVALSRLREEGYYVVKGMLPADVVATARGVCERIVDGLARKLVAEGKAASALEGEPFETRLARLFESHPEDAPRIFREELHTADMAKVFFCPALLDVVEQVLETAEVRLFPNYSIDAKQKQTQTNTRSSHSMCTPDACVTIPALSQRRRCRRRWTA